MSNTYGISKQDELEIRAGCRIPLAFGLSKGAGFDFLDCLKEPFERFSTTHSNTTINYY
jgi:hypothetical protein